MQVHIVNAFENAYGGSERAALAIHEGLRSRCDAQLWCEGRPDPRLARFPIRRIDAAAGIQPVGGTLVIVGNYFQLGAWLEGARPERIILNCNTIVGAQLKAYALERLRSLGRPVEVVFETKFTRDWMGVPGPVFAGRIDLAEFAPSPRPPDGRFVVGRLSRDVPVKHHPEDAALYRRLTEQGLDLRIMGGTCLATGLGDQPRIELLPAGAEPAPQFLRGLDCFLYRTSNQWYEAGGRVICEAMACGLPVVCSRAGGYAEWIDHGRDGFLFDTSEEAEAIVLSLRSDEWRRRHISQAAREKMLALFGDEANRAFFDYFLLLPAPADARSTGPREIVFAWELGAGTGHVTTLLPIASAMKARGYKTRFLLRELQSAADLVGAAEIPREGAPIWNGPPLHPNPLNFGEILLNFGYHEPGPVRALIDAWRERLRGAGAVVANVAPAAHIAARTLGMPSFEISQGFHIPPPGFPAAPLRHWEPAPRERLETADRRVLAAINATLSAYGAPPLASIGDLFKDAAMLLTYPELDIYPERGPAEYYGITDTAEGGAVPPWPPGRGARVFAYVYHYFSALESLLAALASGGYPTLVFCRGIDPALKQKYGGASLHFSEAAMSVSRLLPQSDLVVCHGSHQMTAQALLAGRPVLLLPTQLEQFLIMRRVVRQGAGLGIAPEVKSPDFPAALRELSENPSYAASARSFSRRYQGHNRAATLQTIIGRIEAALKP